jgi:hypothetical protein
MLIERAWWLLNVRYVITWRSELFVPSTILYQEPAANGATYLHRLDEVGPRAWIAHQVEHLPEEAMLDRLAAADFDFRQVALLPPEVELPPLSTSDTDRVEVLSAEPNRLELAVEAGADGLLVISEVDYPGWQAAIDGEPIPLLRADTILRALPVSAGRHEVILTFRPPSFRIGAILSAVTLVGLLFFIVRYGLRRE